MLNRFKQNIKGTNMARKKKEETTEVWPKVIQGSHSTRTEYEDGRVEFVTDWDALQRDVREAIAEYERSKLVEEAPYHPGYEGAVVTQEKPKRIRKK